eukprot:gene16174-22683_t
MSVLASRLDAALPPPSPAARAAASVEGSAAGPARTPVGLFVADVVATSLSPPPFPVPQLGPRWHDPSCAHGDDMLEQVTLLVNHLARGAAPAELAAHLAGAELIALSKKAGGVRPIAMGEVTRRLVAKCLCDAFRDDARAWLWPFQIGAFLREIRNRLPGLAAWAEWCYGAPSNLVYSDTVLSSEVGAQQGDPLGPLLFALAIQPILRQMAEEGSISLTPGAADAPPPSPAASHVSGAASACP